MNGKFQINPENVTQLLCDGAVYQVTSNPISTDKSGSYLDVLAESVTFNDETKRPLSKEELSNLYLLFLLTYYLLMCFANLFAYDTL